MTRARPACVPFDESITCTTCGRFGAYEFDAESLCADCHQVRGACCAESGGNDLWSVREAARGDEPQAS